MTEVSIVLFYTRVARKLCEEILIFLFKHELKQNLEICDKNRVTNLFKKYYFQNKNRKMQQPHKVYFSNKFYKTSIGMFLKKLFCGDLEIFKLGYFV